MDTDSQKMPKEQYDKIIKEILDFVDQFTQVGKNNSNDLTSTFEANHNEWFKVVPFMQDCELYAEGLTKYITAIDLNPTDTQLFNAASYISEFEEYKYSGHEYLINLFHNLGIAWHHLGTIYDNYAIEAFKKSIFYIIGMSSHEAFSPTCYSFRKCSTYLYQALIEEQINLSSPVTFNDPFDSPIIALLDNNDEISMLFRTAYLSCIKIACFVCNVMQPFYKNSGNIYGEIVRDKQKRENNVPEYQNELMWSHYADYHKGICIKYHFQNSLTNLYATSDTSVRYFKDVEYKEDLSVLNLKDSIAIKDAFFVKSKEWEYENELRLLQYDLNAKGDYDTINVPGSIEAIYFGVRCPQKEIESIKKIMEGRKFVTETTKIVNNKRQYVKDEQFIHFFQMVFDSKKFGSLSAVQI
jgi:hypothetical protein